MESVQNVINKLNEHQVYIDPRYTTDEMDEQMENCISVFAKFLEELDDSIYIANKYNLVAYVKAISEKNGLMASDKYIRLNEMLEELDRNRKIRKSGKTGEKKAIDALRYMNTPFDYRQNVQLSYDRERTELDLIGFAENGVFAIEVKHSHRDMVLKENGNFEYADGCHQVQNKTYNLAERMNKQKYILSNILKKGLEERKMTINYELNNILLFASHDVKLIDNYNFIQICYPSNISSYIENFESQVKLTKDEIEVLKDIILEAAENNLYEPAVDTERLKRCFAEFYVAVQNQKSSICNVKDGQEVERKAHIVSTNVTQITKKMKVCVQEIKKAPTCTEKERHINTREKVYTCEEATPMKEESVREVSQRRSGLWTVVGNAIVGTASLGAVVAVGVLFGEKRNGRSRSYRFGRR